MAQLASDDLYDQLRRRLVEEGLFEDRAQALEERASRRRLAGYR